MKKALAIFVALALFVPMVSCNSSTIVSCDYDINFVQYTDKPDFVEMMKGNIPLVPMEKRLSDNIPYTREKVLVSDSLITIKLNRKPKEIIVSEYWLTRDGSFINGKYDGPYTITGSHAIDKKNVLLPIINRFDYGIYTNKTYPDFIVYKAFEMTITFKDDTVEKYAFIIKSESILSRTSLIAN